MKSAYAVLGVPGNADQEEIKQAYEQATKYYSKDKLIENPSLAERLQEVREAYKILSTTELRQLHDRKLSAAVGSSRARAAYPPTDEEPSKWGVLKIMLIAVIGMFAIGTYYAHVREESRKAARAHELALKQRADEEAEKAAKEQAAAEAARARADALAESRERQLRAESAAVGRQVLANQNSALYAQERQAQAERNAALQAERQRKLEAQQRIADDQRQLRNICMQNYGRPNC